MKKYPVQLRHILVKELFIRVNTPEIVEEAETIDDKAFRLEVGYSDFDKMSQTINIALVVTIGNPDAALSSHLEDTAPFDIRVHIMGVFTVDVDNFPLEQLTLWAEQNAPLILYPYLREHVYALSIRSHISPVLLPLMEVPTFALANT